LNRGAGYFKPQSYTITVAKPGYEARTINLRHTMSGWYFANVVIGGALGMLIIDPLTGAMYRLSPNAVNTTLNATTAADPHGDQSTFGIMLAEDVPAQMWKDVKPIQ
jgi:hypothetical protein